MKLQKYIGAFILCLFSGSAFAQTPAELKSWLPAVEGWTIREQAEVFTPDNLFDRINGAAPLFIENNFREMTSLEYKRGEDYITVQAYRHATPEDAFGMYASERSPELEFFPFAGEAQGDASNLFFFAGNIYVKMWGNSQQDISGLLQGIARALAEKIDPDASYPKEIQAFPAENKVPRTETYITSNYIGHEFLRQVFTTDYNIGGKPFQAFILVTDDAAGIQETLEKYMAFTRQTQKPAEGFLTLPDRYNGNMPLLWKGKYLIGVFAPNGDTMPDVEKFLDKIGKNL